MLSFTFLYFVVAFMASLLTVLGWAYRAHLHGFRHWKKRRHAERAVFGYHEIRDTMTGRVLRAAVPPLVDRVTGLEEMLTATLGAVTALAEVVDEVKAMVRPNGGNTLNPGDTTQRLEPKLDQVLALLIQTAQAKAAES